MKNKKRNFIISGAVLSLSVIIVVIGIYAFQAKDTEFVCGKYCFDRTKDSNFEFNNFYISFLEDGTYTYYEGAKSSYIGLGTYTIADNILIMDENESMGYDMYEYFRIDGDKLYFIEEKSSNFIYIHVKDGDTFTYIGES